MVGIILVNYKGAKDTIECLESVLNMDQVDYRIFVVDNSPTRDDLTDLKLWAEGNVTEIPTSFPELVYPIHKKPVLYNVIDEADAIKYEGSAPVVFIKTENRGFAAANNVGIKAALQDERISYFWLLNNDTVVEKDCLLQLKKHHLSSSESCGIVGSLHYYYDQPDEIQALGGQLNKYFGTTRHIVNKFQYKTIDYPLGASMFVSRAYVEDVGYLNEQYFLYYEELDWVFRGNDKGYSCAVEMNSIVYHKEGVSTKGSNKSKSNRSYISDITSLHSRMLFMKEFFPNRLFCVRLGFIIVLFNRLKRGKISIIPDVFKVICGNELQKRRADV